jgi:RNA-directed DNA polymerase
VKPPVAAAQETKARAAKVCLERSAVAGWSMETIVRTRRKALAHVEHSKGVAGVDGISVDGLPA